MDDISAFLKTLKSGAMPGVGIYEWSIRSDRLKWSRGMLDIYGVSEPPRAEHGFTCLVHPEDRVRVEATISANMEAGESYAHEFRIVRPDGSVRVVHDRGVVERDAQGRAVAARGLNVEVTHQRDPADQNSVEPGVARYDYDIATGLSAWTPEAFRLFALEPVDAIRPVEIAVRRILDAGETVGPVDPENGLARRARGTLIDLTDMDRPGEIGSASVREAFGQLVERSPFGIYTVDSDFRIAHASDAARKAFAGVDGLIGRDLGEALRVLWPESFVAEAVARFRHTLMTGESYAAPTLIEKRADIGEVEAYDWKLERVTMPDGRPGVVCSFYDLSRREAEAVSLRETTERLELAYEASGMGAWDLDLRTDAAVWPPQLRRLIGVEETAEATAALFFERVHPDDRRGLVSAFEDSVRTGTDFDAEFRIVRPDGGFRNLVGHGRVVARDADGPTRMIGVNYDVTERRRAARKLGESESRLRLVLDNSVAFMAVLDPDGTMREVNARALEAGGIAREEVLGRRFHETPLWSHDPAQAERVAAAIAEARGGRRRGTTWWSGCAATRGGPST